MIQVRLVILLNKIRIIMFTVGRSLEPKYTSNNNFGNSFSTPFKSRILGSTAGSSGFPRIQFSAKSSRSSSASSFRNSKAKI